MTFFKNCLFLLSLILYLACTSLDAAQQPDPDTTMSKDVKTSNVTPAPKPASPKPNALQNPKNVSSMLVQRTQQAVNPMKFKQQSMDWLYNRHPICTHTLDHDESPITTLQIIDSKHIATGNADGIVRIWNLQTNREVACATPDKSAISALASMPPYLIIGTQSGKLMLLNIKTGASTELLTYYNSINAILPLPNTNQFLVAINIVDPIEKYVNTQENDIKQAFATRGTIMPSSLSVEAEKCFMQFYPCTLWDLEKKQPFLVNFNKNNDNNDVIALDRIKSVTHFSLAHNGKILAKGAESKLYLLERYSHHGLRAIDISLTPKGPLKPKDLLCLDGSSFQQQQNPWLKMEDLFPLYSWTLNNFVFIQMALMPNAYAIGLHAIIDEFFPCQLSIFRLQSRTLARSFTSNPKFIVTWVCSNEVGCNITTLTIFPDGRIATGDCKGRICVWEFQIPDPEQQPARAMTGAATAAAASATAAINS